MRGILVPPADVSAESVVAKRRRSKKRQALIQQFRHLPAHICKRLRDTNRLGSYDIDDAIQVGQMALIRAADGFDARRGVKFITYAWKAIYFSVLAAATKDENIRKVAYTPALKLEAASREYYLEDNTSPMSDKEEAISCLSDLYKTSESKEDLIALLLRCGCPSMTLKEAGRVMGVSKERVRRRVMRLLGED